MGTQTKAVDTADEKRSIPPRVLLADDHGPIIERIKSILQSGFDVVGSVDNGRDLVSEAARLKPDVIVLDISMPGLTGIEAAHELREAGSTICKPIASGRVKQNEHHLAGNRNETHSSATGCDRGAY